MFLKLLVPRAPFSHPDDTQQYEDLERVKRALLAETDTQWREYFERQRFLIESRLRSLNERTGSSTSSAGTP